MILSLTEQLRASFRFSSSKPPASALDLQSGASVRGGLVSGLSVLFIRAACDLWSCRVPFSYPGMARTRVLCSHQLLSNCFVTSQIQGDELFLLVHGGGQASHAMFLAKAMEARHETASVSSGISEGCSARIHSRSISPLTRRMVLSRRDLLSRVPRVPLRPA